MCASCVAQGVTYVGGSVGVLRLMAYRAGRRRSRNTTIDSGADSVAEDRSGQPAASPAT